MGLSRANTASIADGREASQVKGFRTVDVYTMPSFPSTFDVRMGPVGTIAFTKDGADLYYFYCKEGTPPGTFVRCSRRHSDFLRISCGGSIEECMNTFKFVQAAPGSEKEQNEY